MSDSEWSYCELLIRQRAHVGSTIGQQLYTILLVQQLYNSYEYLQFEPLVKIGTSFYKRPKGNTSGPIELLFSELYLSLVYCWLWITCTYYSLEYKHIVFYHLVWVYYSHMNGLGIKCIHTLGNSLLLFIGLKRLLNNSNTAHFYSHLFSCISFNWTTPHLCALVPNLKNCNSFPLLSALNNY